jgi:4-hydroxy-3-methylbut-2-enyl diphosphate reductase
VVASTLYSTTATTGATATETVVRSPSAAVPLQPAGEVVALLAEAGLTVRLGPIASSPSIVNGDEDRRSAAAGGAVAVDMESYWCAPLARLHPFVVVRVVLDVAGRDLWSLPTARGASRAYRSLVRSARALRHWSPVSVSGSPLLEIGDL